MLLIFQALTDYRRLDAQIHALALLMSGGLWTRRNQYYLRCTLSCTRRYHIQLMSLVHVRVFLI